MPFEPYHAFLLRLWRPDPENLTGWRVILEDPHTREINGVDGLRAVFTYLERLTEAGNQETGQGVGNQGIGDQAASTEKF
jgi:hypothetical protein